MPRRRGRGRPSPKRVAFPRKPFRGRAHTLVMRPPACYNKRKNASGGGLCVVSGTDSRLHPGSVDRVPVAADRRAGGGARRGGDRRVVSHPRLFVSADPASGRRNDRQRAPSGRLSAGSVSAPAAGGVPLRRLVSRRSVYGTGRGRFARSPSRGGAVRALEGKFLYRRV